jgi:hypothetical protein
MDTALFYPKGPGCSALRNCILGDLSKFNQRRWDGGEQSHPSSYGHSRQPRYRTLSAFRFGFIVAPKGRLMVLLRIFGFLGVDGRGSRVKILFVLESFRELVFFDRSPGLIWQAQPGVNETKMIVGDRKIRI